MDEDLLSRFAQACSGADDRSIINAVSGELGPGGFAAAWERGPSGWEHVAGADLPTPGRVPEPGQVTLSEGVAVAHVGAGPEAERLVALHGPALDDAVIRSLAQLLAAAVGRVVAEAEADRARRRLDDNERIGRLGSYDWHVPTDTNRWSDELYRIYGEEPQSFNASYERFMDYIHPDDRDHVRAIHEEAFRTGEPFEMEERIILRDGRERLLWSNGEVIAGPDGSPQRFIGICRDVTEQRAAEEAAADAERHRQAAHDAEVRRRAALELNDAVVQGLSAAAFSHDVGAYDVANQLLHGTLERARQVMDDLLEGPEGPPGPGALRRSEPPAGQLTGELSEALSAAAGRTRDVPAEPAPGPRRIIVADDSSDLRELIELQLNLLDDVEVVGVAEDGQEAVDLARALNPDVVLLDLSMPVMDGLEATAVIREELPSVRIIVISGYAAATMRDRCLAVGADDYVEKGGGLGKRLQAAIGAPADA